MKITILDQSFDYANELSVISVCLEQINEIMQENEVYIDVIEIDGVKVYQDYAEYIGDHIADIKLINVKVQTIKQLMDESLITMQQYLTGAIPEVKQLAEEFYQGGAKEGWNKLSLLFEGLLWISQTMETLGSKQVYNNSSVYKEINVNMNEQLSSLESALTDSDNVLTGDILKFEIVTILENLLNTTTATIDEEVERHDLS